MLELYYGKADEDTNAALFGAVKDRLERIEPGLRIIMLVPDQFTLEAERLALKHLEAEGIMDPEIMSPTRLASRVLSETGGGKVKRIDAFGREMLLSKILNDRKNELLIYGKSAEKNGFPKKINDTIYELKQYGISQESLKTLISGMDDSSMLKRKLSDIAAVYGEYESYKEGRYLDGEDYLSLFISKLEESELVRSSYFIVSGFDSFTPKNMSLLKALMTTSKGLSVVMKGESDIPGPKELSAAVFSELSEEARRIGIKIQRKTLEGEPAGSGKRKLRLIECGSIEEEIRRAACEVLSLVRDRGVKYGEIALICNDISYRGRLAKRIFAEYGLPLYIDERKEVLSASETALTLLLVECAVKNRRTETVIGLLKTGLFPGKYALSRREAELLENYALRYKIRGADWKKPFAKGAFEYGDTLEHLESLRRHIDEELSLFEEGFKSEKKMGSRLKALYTFLSDELGMNERFSAESSEIIRDLMEQLFAILGEEVVSGELFYKLLLSGFESAEVGVLPPAEDILMMGTMQRSRFSEIRALLILGANEGLLPIAGEAPDLLNAEERKRLYGEDSPFARLENVRQKEERLRIYENLSSVTEYLYMSYSAANEKGEIAAPAQLFSAYAERYPSAMKKSGQEDDSILMLQSDGGSREFLLSVLRKLREGKELDEREKALLSWHEKHESAALRELTSGLLFENAVKKVDKSLCAALYKRRSGEYIVSPSGLERYAACPFSFFMRYAVSPEERRIYELSGREVGEVYHACLMRLSERLSDGGKVNSTESKWLSATREDIDALIDEFLEEEALRYRGGLLKDGPQEIYRNGRMKKVLSEASWAVVEQVRAGSIRKMELEKDFGGRLENSIPAVKVDVEGERLSVEGRIDRLDRLSSGSVKIIDYKSGKVKFRPSEVEAGKSLQLMLYLMAAEERGKNPPAGAFYFSIDDDAIDEETETRSYKLDGVAVDNAESLRDIAGEIGESSDILPLTRNKDGVLKSRSAGKLLSEEEFREFEGRVREKIEDLSAKMLSGGIDIEPIKTGEQSACTFCDLKGVCLFDPKLPGMGYRVIK